MVVPIAGLIAVLAAAPTASAKPKPTTTTTTTTVPTTTTTETPTSPTTTATPTATADVTYSPLYWELLDRYASVEDTSAPIRGVYWGDPEMLLAPPQEESGASGQAFTYFILNPDGTFGPNGWIADPTEPDGWRELLWSDCMDPDKWSDPNVGLCWM
jgi:hypothetical protein